MRPLNTENIITILRPTSIHSAEKKLRPFGHLISITEKSACFAGHQPWEGTVPLCAILNCKACKSDIFKTVLQPIFRSKQSIASDFSAESYRSEPLKTPIRPFIIRHPFQLNFGAVEFCWNKIPWASLRDLMAISLLRTFSTRPIQKP